MAKVMDLLARMGLVYGPADEETAAPARKKPAATAPAEEPAVPPVAAPAPAVNLDTSAIQLEPADDEYPLEQVYAGAGITDPPHGINVYRLIQMLEAEEFRGLDQATRAKVVAGVLRRLPTGAVEVDDIVRDAALRDQALDAFESFLTDRLATQERDIEERNRALQQEIDELARKNTGLMESNRADAEKQRTRLTRWRQRKQAEEERLYAAIEPFVERNPVSRGEAAAPHTEPLKP